MYEIKDNKEVCSFRKKWKGIVWQSQYQVRQFHCKIEGYVWKSSMEKECDIHPECMKEKKYEKYDKRKERKGKRKKENMVQTVRDICESHK